MLAAGASVVPTVWGYLGSASSVEQVRVAQYDDDDDDENKSAFFAAINHMHHRLVDVNTGIRFFM